MAFITKQNIHNVRKNQKTKTTVAPTARVELINIVKDTIDEYGPDCDLNFIDVSKINDMAYLFNQCDTFNGDISEWDVSNVRIMRGLFCDSAFNGDISDWDVGKVEDMRYMFIDSAFNGDISKWDVSSVKHMQSMFGGENTKFNGDISDWNVSNVESFSNMFENNRIFEGDLSKWDVRNSVEYAKRKGNYPLLDMFASSKLSKTGRVPQWYYKYIRNSN